MWNLFPSVHFWLSCIFWVQFKLQWYHCIYHGRASIQLLEHYFDFEKKQIVSGDGLKEDVDKVLQVSPIKG